MIRADGEHASTFLRRGSFISNTAIGNSFEIMGCQFYYYNNQICLLQNFISAVVKKGMEKSKNNGQC